LASVRKKLKPEQRARVLRALYALSLERGTPSETDVEHVLAVAVHR